MEGRRADPERLRLLEAVAAATQANTRLRHGLTTMRFAECLAGRGNFGNLMGHSEWVLLEALVALEASEEQAREAGTGIVAQAWRALRRTDIEIGRRT